MVSDGGIESVVEKWGLETVEEFRIVVRTTLTIIYCRYADHVTVGIPDIKIYVRSSRSALDSREFAAMAYHF